MPLTIEELMEKLMALDELSIIEHLHLTSEQLIERFDDVVEDMYEELHKELVDEEENSQE